MKVSVSVYDPLKGTRIVIRNATDRQNEPSKTMPVLGRGS